MRQRTALARILAGLLLVGLVAVDGAWAGRLDDAGRALRDPGVWVDRDLSWLVTPAQARRLERRIDAAGVPVRVAMLPQVEVDESRGDQQAIVRGIIRRAGADGLYVLVDQQGGVEYAARDLPLDLSEFSFPRPFPEPPPLQEQLDAIVPTVRAARPAAPPVSFEPFSSPKGVPLAGTVERDSLLLIALVCLALGLLVGGALHAIMRCVLTAVRRTRRALAG